MNDNGPRLEVKCQLSDCMYHHTDPHRPGVVLCSHKDKPHYMKARPCPLYRLDIGKQGDLNEAYKKFLK